MLIANAECQLPIANCRCKLNFVEKHTDILNNELAVSNCQLAIRNWQSAIMK